MVQYPYRNPNPATKLAEDEQYFYPIICKIAEMNGLQTMLGKDVEPYYLYSAEIILRCPDYKQQIVDPPNNAVYVVALDKDGFWLCEYVRDLIQGFMMGMRIQKEMK